MVDHAQGTGYLVRVFCGSIPCFLVLLCEGICQHPIGSAGMSTRIAAGAFSFSSLFYVLLLAHWSDTSLINVSAYKCAGLAKEGDALRGGLQPLGVPTRESELSLPPELGTETALCDPIGWLEIKNNPS